MSQNNPAARAAYAQAVDCIKKQDFAGAEKYLTESLGIAPTADAAHNLGTLRFMQGQIDKAVELFHQAVTLDPHYDAAYANLMRISHQKGDIAKAIEYSAMAMTAAPDKRAHKIEFTKILNKLKFEVSNPEVKRLVTFCLEDGTLNYDKMGLAWLSLMIADPELGAIYKLYKQQNFKSFEKEFGNLKDYSALVSRYFTMGLQQMTVGDTDFERFLTALRRLILKDHIADNGVLFSQNFLSLIAALSIYCFYTEYILDVSEEERAWLENLRENLPKQDKIAKDPKPLCILACYENIYKHPHAEKFTAALSGKPELQEFVKYHLSEPLEEMRIVKEIIALTNIDSETSVKVQEMYEELPYPRWRYIPEITEPFDTTPVREVLPQGKLKILNAGCGTGREAIYMARTFPDSEVMAVDLSRTSLAYGIRKTAQHAITNITFRQADILELSKAFKAESFDIIASSGVLHHLEKPEDGLAVLVKLLKPGGAMNLALYSEIARRSIVRARKVIAEKSFGHDSESARTFRRDIELHLPEADIENLRGFRDYFFLSEFKDLIFHVMEHRFTIPQLRDMLARQNLEFMGFKDNPAAVADYAAMFPNDPEKKNLDNWHKYETANPDAFRQMYQFWVRKKPG